MADTPIPRFRDFSAPVEGEEDPITFRIAPDTFTCVDDIDIDGLAEMARYGESGAITTENWREAFAAVGQIVLVPASAARFRDRLQTRQWRDAQDPPVPAFGVKTLTQVLPWLMETFGLVPIQPSSASVDGSADDGTGSTDGPPPTA